MSREGKLAESELLKNEQLGPVFQRPIQLEGGEKNAFVVLIFQKIKSSLGLISDFT